MPEESDEILYVSSQFYKALDALNWKVDPEKIAEKIKQLEFGLPNEDEFAFLASWMGNCNLIHKLDQVQIPSESRKKYLVPDFIAMFRYQGRVVPVLIEVKTTQRSFLSWRKEYYLALKEYANTLGIPLLIAWKLRVFGHWILTDISNFDLVENRYRLSLDKAMKENLMGLLLGDFSFVFQEKFKLVFDFKKISKVNEVVKRDGTKETQWNMQVQEVYYVTSKGVKTTKIEGPLSAAFFCCNQLDETQEFENNLLHSFYQNPESFQSAHQMMIAFMKVANNDKKIRWKEVLRDGTFKIDFNEFVSACHRGFENGIIKHVFDQVPQNYPSYLKK